MNRQSIPSIRKVFLLFLALVLLVGTVQATDIAASDNSLDDPLVDCVPELYQIDDLLSEIVQENNAKEKPDQFDIVSYDVMNAYRVIPMQNLPLTIYNQTGDFDATLTDEAQWRVPVMSAKGEHGLYCLKETENGLETYSTDYGVGIDLFTLANEDFESLRSSDLLQSVTSIQYVHSYMYSTLFVRAFTEDGEYLIPYSLYENELDIQNGTVYTVSDLMDILTEHLDEQYLYDHPDQMGLVPLRSEIVKTAWIKAAVYVVPALLIAGGVVFVILFRRRRHKAL